MDALHIQRLIAMTEVESSTIHSVGHHAPSLTLAIRFKAKAGPGSLYHYQNVKAETFGELSGAASVGAYFKEHIKAFPTAYPFKRIDETDEAEAAS